MKFHNTVYVTSGVVIINKVKQRVKTEKKKIFEFLKLEKENSWQKMNKLLSRQDWYVTIYVAF